MRQSSRYGDERPQVVAVLDAVAGLLDDLDAGQVWRCTDAELVTGVDAAYALRTRLHAVGINLVGEVDRRGVATTAGAHSVRSWLGGRLLLRPSHAKRDVDLARLIPAGAHAGTTDTADHGIGTTTIGGTPGGTTGGVTAGADEPTEGAAVGAALVAGDISVEHAGVVATALAELPQDLPERTRVVVEVVLVEEARVLRPEELARFGHQVLERVDPDAADRKLQKQLEREEREAARLRGGTRYADGHGNVFYRFRVPVGDDAHIWAVLDCLAKPAPSGAGGPDPRTARQRLADAFVEGMRRVSLDGGLPANGGDRPRAVVTMSLDTLRAGIGTGTNVDTGDLLTAATVRRLACDAQVVPVVLDGAGQPLDVGHAKRSFDGPIRVAVIARDGGCVHPGCDRPPRWCDVHHALVSWWAGGATALDNGVLLCGFHHRLYDDATWSIRFAADGIPEAVPPKWVDPQRQPIRHTRLRAKRRPTAA